jgi:hypothetical protein
MQLIANVRRAWCDASDALMVRIQAGDVAGARALVAPWPNRFPWTAPCMRRWGSSPESIDEEERVDEVLIVLCTEAFFFCAGRKSKMLRLGAAYVAYCTAKRIEVTAQALDTLDVLGAARPGDDTDVLWIMWGREQNTSSSTRLMWLEASVRQLVARMLYLEPLFIASFSEALLYGDARALRLLWEVGARPPLLSYVVDGFFFSPDRYVDPFHPNQCPTRQMRNRNRAECLRVLLVHYDDLHDVMTNVHGHFLHTALFHGEGSDVVHVLLEAGVDPDARNALGETPLAFWQKRSYGHWHMQHVEEGPLIDRLLTDASTKGRRNRLVWFALALRRSPLPWMRALPHVTFLQLLEPLVMRRPCRPSRAQLQALWWGGRESAA